MDPSFICVFLPLHSAQIVGKEERRPASPSGGRGCPGTPGTAPYSAAVSAGPCSGSFWHRGKKKKPLGGEEGRAQPSWLAHALTPCGLEHEIVALQHKMKMPVKYLLEAIQA